MYDKRQDGREQNSTSLYSLKQLVHLSLEPRGGDWDGEYKLPNNYDKKSNKRSRN